MATVNKRGNKAGNSGSKTIAAAKSTTPSAKMAVPEKVVATKNAGANKGAASTVKKPDLNKKIAAKPEAKKRVGPSKTGAPETQKKLASRHIWDLVEAKKRNATKTPAWQSIAHHDHPAPRGGKEQGADQGSAGSTHIEMPGHRDRGTG